MRILANRTNRILLTVALCLCVLLAIGGFGCKKQGASPSPTPEPNAATTTPSATSPVTTAPDTAASTSAVTPAPGPDTVAATVNGEVIGQREVDAIIDMNIQQNIQRMGGQVDPERIAKYREQLKPRALDNLVMQRLLDQQVQAAHISVSDDEVASAMKERLAAYGPEMTPEKYKEIIEAQGGNYQEFMGQFKKNLAHQRLIESLWAGKVDVNDQEVQDYYNEHPDEFKKPEQVRASHILIKPDVSDPNTDPNDAKAAARTKIEGLLAQIKAGADFAELAKANSDCPSAEQGGDLDFFVRDQMVKPFSDAAFALEPNQVSDIVETRFGYHIIKVTDRTPEGIQPFDEVKAGIMERLGNQKKRKFVEGFLASIKERATIVYPQTQEAQPEEPAVVTPPAAATPPAAVTPPPATPEASAPAPSPTPADANEN